MARGMWVGLAAGIQQAQENKRYQQERQDKLNLLNQERQDKLFSLALQFAPKYAASSVFTPLGDSETSGKSGFPSPKYYETQLKAFGFSDENIADLYSKGPYAMKAAIDVYDEIYDETSPPDQTTLQKIADSIIIENISQEPVDAKTFAEKMGLNIEDLSEAERTILTGALTLAPKAPNVASTYRPTAPVKPEDVTKYQTFVAETIKTVIQQGQTSTEDVQKQSDYAAALRELDAGDPTRAIEMLKETGQLVPTLKPLFEYYPQLSDPNLPLGVFEPVRKALEVSTPATTTPTGGATKPLGKAVMPIEQAIEMLKANPSLKDYFEETYGVSADEYLNG